MEYVTLDDYEEEEAPPPYVSKRMKDLELLLEQTLDFLRGTSKIPPCDLAFMIESTIEAGEDNEDEVEKFLAGVDEVDSDSEDGGLDAFVGENGYSW